MLLPRLWWRIYCCYFIGCTLLTVVLAWVATANQVQVQQLAQRQYLESLAATIRTTQATTLAPELAEQLQRRQVRYSLWQRPDAANKIADSSQQSSELQRLWSGQWPTLYRREIEQGETTATIFLPLQTESPVLQIIQLTQRERDFQIETPRSITGIALICWGLCLGLGWWIIRKLLQPTQELAITAERVSRGLPLGKSQIQQTQELQHLSQGLETLYRRLEEDNLTLGRRGTEQAAILASMVEGVLAVDSDERIITLNRAAAQLTDIPISEASGKSLQAVLRNADLRRFVQEALVSLDSIQADISIRASDRDRTIQAHGTALHGREGRAIGAVIVLNDVTHTRHLENIRRDFVANVSHELKTPIASIKGFVETLLDGAIHDPNAADRFLKIVVKQADRLDMIIEDLLSLSKIEQSEEAGNLPLDVQPLRPILEAVLHDCHTKAGERQVTVHLDCSDQVVTAVNARLLEQAVVNLVDNAIKYSDAGEIVQITATTQTHEVTIAVRDDGPGIEAEHLPRLFERFYRVDKARSRKLGGTGLGLAIVKHIVQAHRGRIDVASTVGQGSTFSIRLPLILEQPTAEPLATETPS